MSGNRSTTRTTPDEPDGVRTPLRGRDAARASVEERLDALGRGTGGIVLVEGPAGIGRTRILAEAAASARRRGTRVFEGAADPDAQFVPLAPLLEAVLSGEDPLAGAAPLRDLATTPGRRFWLLQELGDRLREAARNGPLLVVLDDLQWCDDLTLLTFHTLAAGLSAHPILWLAAVRSGSVPSGVRTTLDRIRQAGAHELVLEALEDRAVARIAEDVLGAPPGPDVLRLARRAEGVPQLLVELLGSLREEAVTIENGTAGLPAGPPAPRHLPSVRRRLDQLSDGARELVRTAAAVGGTATVALLADLLGRTPAALITAVREALDADLLTESGDRLAFRQDLIREAVEADLPLTLRQALRRHAGLPPGGPQATATEAGGAAPGDAAEVDRLRAEAAELAVTAPRTAADRSLRALELLAADAPERPRVVAETIPLLWQTGRVAQARALGAATLEAGGLAPEDEAFVRLALARLSVQFDFTEAVRQARAGAALPGISPTARGRLLAMLAVGLSMSGEHAAAERVAAQAWETAAVAGDRTAEATLTTVRSAASFHRMDLAEAFRQAERSAALADALGVSTSLWVPEALWHALLSNTTGRTAEALAAAEEGIRITREQGRTVATRMWLMTRTRVLLETGRLADARADAEAASPAAGEPGPGNLADVTLRYVMLRVALHTGDRRTAEAYAAQARRMRDDDALVVRHFGAWMLALMADHEGRPDRAMAALDAVMTAPAADRPAYAGLIDPADAPVLVRMALRAGRHDRAAQAVATAERRAVLNPGLPFLAATAAHARGLLDNDLAPLVRAVRLYEDCPRVLARASALEDAGRKLGATRKAEAVPSYEQALALYTRAGAERDAARVSRRLRAAGVRRRPSTARPDDAWPELTPAETRVARLVAQGLANRQVAERLSLSPHTVSSHLRRAFTKLDVTSRAELTRLVGQRDSGE
ncbi:helix-turn-helix transcriptional regulator [Streptomyces sp. NPDC085529]|uniref:helix-turn-helix transcriptional regulator n=1 Tax=Streptomyces sp. NPDC085529 TaxID=3365729 RepID=UPI0037D6776A